MKFSLNCQYALLFGFYLCTYGKSDVEKASKALNIPKVILNNIVSKLCAAKILVYLNKKDGYQLAGNPTVGDFVRIIDEISWLKVKEVKRYMIGKREERILLNFVRLFNQTTQELFNKTLNSVYNQYNIDSLYKFEMDETKDLGEVVNS